MLLVDDEAKVQLHQSPRLEIRSLRIPPTKARRQISRWERKKQNDRMKRGEQSCRRDGIGQSWHATRAFASLLFSSLCQPVPASG
jgi:hypothetical protein